MVSLEYKDNEKEFLQDMVVKFCFSDNTELAFVERLRLCNSEVATWEKLADCLDGQLRENAKKKKDENDVDVEKLLRDRWDKTICPKLELMMKKDGDSYKFNGQGKWLVVRKWLVEVKYPEWLQEKQKLEGLLQRLRLLTISALWEELKIRATPTDKMGPRVHKISTMDMWQSDSDYPNTVPLDSQIKIEVQLESPGYLTLLEKGTSGKLYCLSPSFLAPDPNFNQAGVISLPMEGARDKYFKVTGNTGVEEIIAAIAPQRPNLDWLPKPDQPPLLLQRNHLQEFVAYFEGKSDCTLWYMNYQVV